MKKLLFIAATIVLTGCYAPSEGFVQRNTTGSPYHKKGLFKERTKIPAPWK